MVAAVSPELRGAVAQVLAAEPEKLVISSPRSKAGLSADLGKARLQEHSAGGTEKSSEQHFEKIVVTLRNIREQQMFQAEQFTRTQVFHRNLTAAELADYLEAALASDFRQLDAFSPQCDFNIRISKKGKVMVGKHKKTAAKSVPLPFSGGIAEVAPGAPSAIPQPQSHNRKKKRLLEEGTVIPPLVDMGVFTPEGRIVRSMGDKFRQINRFLEIVNDAIDACGFEELTIVDFGCGKAYLTFILYYYLTYVKRIRATMIGLDLKKEVIADCQRAAEKYGYDNLHFEVGDISQYTASAPVDMVITLHACDTATDHALYHAIRWGSRVILSVPCCQHELNAQIYSDNDSGNLMTKYGIIKERFAALATDALRASLLEHEGYKTQVLEFVDLSHTPKNLLIRAVKTNIPKKKKQRSLAEVEALMQDFHAEPTLYRLLCPQPEDRHEYAAEAIKETQE